MVKRDGVILEKSLIKAKEIQVDFRKSFEQAPSKFRASTKQPVSDLYPCGRIPQNAAPLLARPLMVRQPYSEAV